MLSASSAKRRTLATISSSPSMESLTTMVSRTRLRCGCSLGAPSTVPSALSGDAQPAVTMTAESNRWTVLRTDFFLRRSYTSLSVSSSDSVPPALMPYTRAPPKLNASSVMDSARCTLSSVSSVNVPKSSVLKIVIGFSCCCCCCWLSQPYTSSLKNAYCQMASWSVWSVPHSLRSSQSPPF